MATAFGYGRVSSGRQKDSGLSEGDQRKVCDEAFAARMARRGYAWGGFHFDGGVSAGKVLFFDRPAAAALWKQAGEGDVVIVAKQDRLVRRIYDWAQVVHQFRRRGVLLAIENMGTSDGEVVRMDPFCPFNKAMLGVAAVFAELELDQISDRNRRRVKRCKAEGRPAGRAPLGFRTIDMAGGKYVVPDADARMRCRWMIAMQEAGHGVQKITDELNARGYRVAIRRADPAGARPRYTPEGHYSRMLVSHHMRKERLLQRAEAEAGADWLTVVYIPGLGGVRVDSLDPTRRRLFLEAGRTLAQAEARRRTAAETAVDPAGVSG